MTTYRPDQAPICEDCNVQMVLRKRKVDDKEFYGCPRFPRCSNTEAMDGEDGISYGDAYNSGMFSA